MMMITPMPLIKPGDHRVGHEADVLADPEHAEGDLEQPASMTAVRIRPTSPDRLANRPARTTTIGPVGPETLVGVPPNSAAKKPTKMAPYMPAIGPSPEATPKASASGIATTPAVRPP
jgi:hypothetical protein